jgi:two-component system, response regulator / RNA-binding antiterminator
MTWRVKVLVADLDDRRAEALAQDLAFGREIEIVRLEKNQSLAQAVRQQAPDVVLVDMALPDRDALEDIRLITADAPRPIVLFTDHDDPAFMEEAIAAGISSYTVVGASLPDVKPIIRTAVALFNRHRQVEAELRRAEATIAEARVVDKAKRVLMRRHQLAEPEAYKMLRRQAMNEGRRIPDIAAQLVNEADGCLGK